MNWKFILSVLVFLLAASPVLVMVWFPSLFIVTPESEKWTMLFFMALGFGGAIKWRPRS